MLSLNQNCLAALFYSAVSYSLTLETKSVFSLLLLNTRLARTSAEKDPIPSQAGSKRANFVFHPAQAKNEHNSNIKKWGVTKNTQPKRNVTIIPSLGRSKRVFWQEGKTISSISWADDTWHIANIVVCGCTKFVVTGVIVL